MKKKSLLGLSLLITLTSCASYEHVRPGADGVHKVVVRGVDKTEVEEQAIREAKAFCEDRNQAAAFINEESKYTGSMDERTHKTLGKISKAATVGGGMMGVMGGRKERNAGQGVFGAGVVGGVLQDGDAYTSNMSFKCI